MANQLSAATLTEHEANGIDKYRLARTGLSGQHAHAFREFRIDSIDDCKVPNLQAGQHAVALRLGTPDTTVATPEQFIPQNPEVVMARRMDQADPFIRRRDGESVVRKNFGERSTVNGDFGANVLALEQANFYSLVRGDNDWPVCQRMRTDGYHDDGIEVRLDNWSAAA